MMVRKRMFHPELKVGELHFTESILTALNYVLDYFQKQSQRYIWMYLIVVGARLKTRSNYSR